MKEIRIMSPREVYIEINGLWIGNVRKYKIKETREEYVVTTMGEKVARARVPKEIEYKIELSMINMIGLDEKENILDLSDFNMVITKGKKQIMFDHCNWINKIESSGIEENKIIEELMITATKKLENKIK